MYSAGWDAYESVKQGKYYERQRGRGVLLILLSTIGFGFMQICAALTSKNISVMEQTFFRNLIGLIVVGVIAGHEHIPFLGEKKYWPHVFARSFFGFIGVVFLFYAARNANQADVTIVTRMSVFTTTAASVIFLKENLTRFQTLMMIVAFGGAFVAAGPSLNSSALPILAALGNAICSSISYVLLSYFTGKVKPLTVVLNFCGFSTIAAGLLMFRSFVFPSYEDLLNLLMIGVFAAIGQISMTFAYRMAPAGEISIYSQSAIIVNAVLGFFFLREIPSMRTLLGGALVIGASVLLFLHKQGRFQRRQLS